MEDIMKIKSNFMTCVVSKIINTVIHRKLGYKIETQFNEVCVSVVDGKISVHLDVKAEMTNEELIRILKDNGVN